MQPTKSTWILTLTLALSFTAFSTDKADSVSAEKEKRKPIIEEVVVNGRAPAQQPVSRVSRIPRATIETVNPSFSSCRDWCGKA